MATRIFTPPVGLLDLLGTKAVGRNPSEIAATVSAGLDILPLLAIGHGVEILLGTPTVPTAVGPWVTHTVPDNQLWLLHSYAAWVETGAGDTVQFFALMLGAGAPGNVNVIDRSDAPNIAVAANSFGVVAIRGPRWLPPGYALGFGVQTGLSGSPGVESYACITRVSI